MFTLEGLYGGTALLFTRHLNPLLYSSSFQVAFAFMYTPRGPHSDARHDQVTNVAAALPNPLTLDSKSELGWQLHLSIADASGDKREAPWYGPWCIVLNNFLFRNFCPRGYLTVTYPQFPLTKDVDTYNPEDENIEDDDTDSQTKKNAVLSPSTPSKFPARQRNPATPPSRAISHQAGPLRFSAPSPEVYKGFRQDLPQTPPIHPFRFLVIAHNVPLEFQILCS